MPPQVDNPAPMAMKAASPTGFTPSATGDVALLRHDGGRWALDGQALPDTIDGAALDRLRPLRGVRVQWPDSAAPLEQITQLAAAGVPLLGGQVPGWVADRAFAALIADEGWLGEEIDSAGASVAELRREEFSVRLRRHAFRGAGHTEDKVSVIMASRRPWMVKRALAQIARQRHVDVEVVLALHGYTADTVKDAVADFPLPLTVIEADRERVLGDVLNQAAARAGGNMLAKWDDDDSYGPEHLTDLLMARAYSGADVVGSAAQFFYLEPLDVTIRRTDYAGEVWADHVAGGTIMLSRRLFDEIGGFGPRSRGEDAHLLRAAEAVGSPVYRAHGLGYVLHRSLSTDHTWQLPLAHFLRVATNQWRGFRPSVILEAL